MRINNKNVRLGVFIALMLPVSVFAESVFNGFIPLKDTMDSVEQKLKEKNLTYMDGTQVSQDSLYNLKLL